MKKFFTVTFCLAAACALAGCGNSHGQSEATTAMELSTEDAYEDINPVELNASEYVELGNYKGLTVTVETVEVSDEDVEEELQNFVEGYAEYEEIEDRDIVQEGDYVNIDYTCTIDGNENEEYSDSDVDVKAGDGELNSYLGVGLDEDFDIESKVIGAEIGSSVSTEFTFPKDYDDDAVAGKKCTLNVVVNTISKEVIPELNDAFIKENTESNTLEEYKKEIRDSLQEQADAENESAAQDEIWNQILDNAKQKKDFTDEMLEQEAENLRIQNREFVEMYLGMEVEEYLTESSGMTMEELSAQSLKGQCVQDLLVEAEKISVTDDEMQEEMENIASETGLESVDEVKELYSEEEIRSNLISTKLFDKLMEYTTVKTIPVSAQIEADDLEVEE